MNRILTSPAVSVVIAAYNASRWIAKTLDSVLAQTFRDFEVVVVDDGSTDETPNVIAGYGTKVRYLHKENGGAASARNVGIRAARGSYIAFLDADDLWLSEKLQLQMQLFSKYPALAWVYSDAEVFEGQSVLYKVSQRSKLHAGDILRPLLLQDFIPSPTPLIRREVFDTVGYFDESPLLRIGEDWNMWLRIAAKYHVEFVDQPLARIRTHATSMTGSMDLQYAFRSKLTIIENAIARDPERLSDLRERAIANLYTATGEWMLKREDPIGARRMFAYANRLYHYEARIFVYWILTFFPRSFLRWLIGMRRALAKIRR